MLYVKYHSVEWQIATVEGFLTVSVDESGIAFMKRIG